MTTEQQPRRRREPLDTLPELVHYRDDGCEVWHACLSCPLERCIHDAPRERQHSALALRDAEIQRFYRAGWTVDALAERYMIGRRQIYRIVRGSRAADPPPAS